MSSAVQVRHEGAPDQALRAPLEARARELVESGWPAQTRFPAEAYALAERWLELTEGVSLGRGPLFGDRPLIAALEEGPDEISSCRELRLELGL